MSANSVTEVLGSDEPGCHASETTIAYMVGKVFETAPLAERSRLLEHLLQPIGVLGLVAVANGIFARIRFRSGWPNPHVRIEDAQNVQASDVIKLVEYVQQVSVQTVDGLAQIVGVTPMMASSAAAALLVTVLVRRARTRRADDN
jgi:hypothetical protein